MKTIKPISAPSAGFALVATLSVSALVTLLIMALLGLSLSTTRLEIQNRSQAEAQANARLSLKLAIGALQKQLGPDQRVSANANILSDPASPNSTVASRHWTGVWSSWKAGIRQNSQHSTIGRGGEMAPKYQSNRRDYFQGWLLSLNTDEARNVDTPKTLALSGSLLPQQAETAVTLVGPNTLGSTAPATDQINARLLAPPVSGSGKRNRFAYWIGDESQKARLMSDTYTGTSALTLAQRLARTQAPAAPGTKTISELEGITPEQDARLQALPNLSSLDLLMNTPGKSPARTNFHSATPYSRGVLADVREGGMKRDLQTILEKPINPGDVYNLEVARDARGGSLEFQWATSLKPNGNEYLLYSFDDMVISPVGMPVGQATVPIQDLSAYYQMYDSTRPGWRGGIQFTSSTSSPSNNLLRGGVMVSNPDYGVSTSDYVNYLRQSSALYRNVYPIKIEYVLSYLTEQRPQADIDRDRANGNPSPDTHWIKIGITPSMTWWNPNNVPVVMNFGDPDLASIMIRENAVPLQIDLRKHETFGGPITANRVLQLTNVTNTQQGELYTLFISGRTPLVFQPGECKVLALQYSSQSSASAGLESLDFYLRGTGSRFAEPFVPSLELVPGWNPGKFIRPTGRNGVSTVGLLTFKATDFISANISTGTGKGYTVDFTQKSRHGRNAPGVMWHFRSYGIYLRRLTGGDISTFGPFRTAFNSAGFNPSGGGIADTNSAGILLPGRSAGTLINSMQDPGNLLDDIPQAFFYYGMKAATETHESANAFPASGFGAARRFPSRPFTHSTAMMPQYIDTIAGPNLYNIGWNWFFMPLNNSLDAPVSISRDSYGYYGGGYTAENGTTHVVQQHLPVSPPISIASLSSAQLSGYSLSEEAATLGFNGLPGRDPDPTKNEPFLRTTAIGFGGLEPRTLQAIGNSYAHPYIPKNEAITTLGRVYVQNTANPNPTQEPYADHSYLANKALWDEFFFSSIYPTPGSNPVFNSPVKSVADVVTGFYLRNEPLPNRRLIPYLNHPKYFNLTEILSQYWDYRNGFADKIGAYMMVEGPFNVNTTSEAAWKTLFTSLRGKPVSHLDLADSTSGSLKVTESTPAGVPVASGTLPNGKPYTGSTSDPSSPEQWTGWRELTDKEIDELAKAMVKQVKKRGPFLSMSEFVNRRLDANSTELSLMGALQAAIDDPQCSINQGFRNGIRRFNSRERSWAGAAFPEALDGPVAYGSSAYLDQADILRNFAEQLTPRGDTFVVRAYADSVDASGKVAARAWCEAVVQRLPNYSDTSNAPQLKAADPTLSLQNKLFGRRMQVINFRWLDPSEI